MRSIRTLFAANEGQLAKLSAELSVDTEQAAKNLPSVTVMMEALVRKAPPAALAPLTEFMAHNWKALNSYTHSGIHPLRRHQEGYPLGLMINAIFNVNGLLVLTAMQAAILTGVPNLQRNIIKAAERYDKILRQC